MPLQHSKDLSPDDAARRPASPTPGAVPQATNAGPFGAHHFRCYRVPAAAPWPSLAGPPFLTDDPVPVDYRHWEINNYASSVFVKGASFTAAPASDINYGLLPNVQAHVNVALATSSTAGVGTSVGPADLELGVKYRFLDAKPEDWWPQIAIFPFLDLPTGNAAQGLGTGSVHGYLPVWIQKDLGEWTTYGGGGYWINPGPGNRNYWYTGWALLRKVTDLLQLGGEIFHQTSSTIAAPGTAGFSSAPRMPPASTSAALTISIKPITCSSRLEPAWRTGKSATNFRFTWPCKLLSNSGAKR